uniref:Small ribosomal subunit protein uS3c n=1 Tax=Nitzschia sp. PL1-4 TaxID=2083272 RepID=A0A2Z5ZB26_9STRA|nr:ribosomal protein S3 [Nitzschia sp. PL1-4]
MGQKIHPIGFRLSTSNNYQSFWYSKIRKKYIKYLKEDNYIRQSIHNQIKKRIISHITISRIYKKSKKIYIYIKTNDIRFFSTKIREKIKKDLTIILSSEYEIIDFKIFKIQKVYLDSGLIVNLIADQIEKRIHFKRIMNSMLQKIYKEKDIIGVKILLAGRLNGSEIARTEWVLRGSVPLQTIEKNIQYSTAEANTIFGIIGIKVWISKKD